MTGAERGTMRVRDADTRNTVVRHAMSGSMHHRKVMVCPLGEMESPLQVRAFSLPISLLKRQ